MKDAIGDDPTSTTYYSYDIHGNVDTLLQSYGKGVLNEVSGHMTKRIEYNYDLISGKVNEVAYQPGMTDQFYHRYVYDAENRLTQVYTSADRQHWEKQAGYSYYRHGPLARTELGQLKVQGIDYAYTLQGWLKGVNSNAIGSSFDMGGDGTGTSRPARDAYSYSLQYNAGDYKAVSTNKYPFVKVDYLAPVTDAQPVGRGLYNGNISSMLVNIPKLGDAQLYGYSYDQLNRLTAMNAYTGLNTGNNSFVPVGSTNYKERVSYDGNGNILSYLRNRAGVGADTSMDKLSYTYEYDGDGFLVKNRLKQVSDAVVSTPAGTGDLPTGQVSDNYGYDAIGNLVKDESEGIASGGIEWNVYGKISQITKTNSGVTTVIKYTYDATGNRIGKWVQVGAGTPKQTAYVRDASGNVMAIYEKGNSEVNGGLLSQIEVPLYGSSRLGVWRPDREVETTGWELFDTDPMTGTGGGIAGGWERGRVQFELSNHLGNVLVTISDVRIPVLMPEGIELCDDPVHPACYRPIDYYLPQVLTANDYYPFGMGMPGRKYSEGEYRYGFNGKENDNDVKGEGNQQDYGMRIYDPRLGKFLSVDPLTEEYPWYTPYQFAGNKPIEAVDLDGEEEAYANLLPSYRAADRNSLIVAGVKRQKAESEWLSRLNDYEVVQWNPYRQRAEIGRRTNVEKRIRADRNEYSVALGENIRGGVFGSGLYLLAGDKGAFAGGPLDQIMTTKVALTNPSAPSVRSKPVTRQPAVASKVINNNVIANGAQNQVEPISNPVNFKYLKGFGRENPYTYLGEALTKQHLNRIPAALKESWSSNGFDYEVRIHPADSKYGLSGSIFRVARRLQGTSGNNQGFGFEYLDINGNWFPQSVLKPGKAGNSNPTYNEQAAKDTHIKLNANN